MGDNRNANHHDGWMGLMVWEPNANFGNNL